MLNPFASAKPASSWNPFSSPKSVLPKALAPAPKKGLLPSGLFGKKPPTSLQSLTKLVGPLAGLLPVLLPLLGVVLAVAAFQKLVNKKPLSSLVPSKLKELNPLKNLSLPSLKPLTDKLPSLKPITDKLPSLKPLTDKLPSVKSLTDKLPSLPKLPGAKLPTDKLANGKLPDLKNLKSPLANLPNGSKLSKNLPKGHFLSDKLPKPQLPGPLKWLNPIEALKSTIKTAVLDVLHLDKVPGIKDIINWFMKPKGFIPKGTLATLSSLPSLRPGLLSKLNPLNAKIFNRKKIAEEEDDEKFQAGEPYGDPEVVSTNLVQDLRTIGFATSVKDLKTLITAFKAKGKPQNDREMLVSGEDPVWLCCNRS